MLRVEFCIQLMYMRWVGHIVRMGEMRNSHKTLVGKPEGNVPLGRPTYHGRTSSG